MSGPRSCTQASGGATPAPATSRVADLGLPRVFRTDCACYGTASHSGSLRVAFGAGAERTTDTLMNPPGTARRHFVSKDEAVLLLQRRPTKISQRGGHLPRSVVDQVLAQPGCEGLRFYFGTKADGSLTLVFVGINGDEKDMTEGLIAEDWYPCPPFCDATSSLIR